LKHLTVRLHPSAEVHFDAEEIAILIECSAMHYDAACRLAGEGRSEGAAINGILKIFEARIQFEPTCTHNLEFRELDTLAKILEVGQYLEKEKFNRSVQLGVAIQQTLMRLNNAAAQIPVA